MVDRFKCANALYFTLIINKHFNLCCFRALAYTTLDRLCAVFFLYNLFICFAFRADKQRWLNRLSVVSDASSQCFAVMGQSRIKYYITILIKFTVSEIVKVLLDENSPSNYNNSKTAKIVEITGGRPTISKYFSIPIKYHSPSHHSLNGSSDSVNGDLQFLWG